MAKEKEEKSSFADVAAMSPEQRSVRTHKKHVYSCLLALHKAIWDAKKAGVDIGNVKDLDCSLYFDAVRVSEKFDRVGMGSYTGR